MIECAESSAALTPQSQKANFQKVTLIILNFKMERFTKKLRFFHDPNRIDPRFSRIWSYFSAIVFKTIVACPVAKKFDFQYIIFSNGTVDYENESFLWYFYLFSKEYV